MMASPAVAVSEQRRERSVALRARYPFAAQMLTLYETLLKAQLLGVEAAGIVEATPEAIAVAAAEHIMPLVIDATLVEGPPHLVSAVSERFSKGGLVEIAARWLADDELSDVDRYLARTATQPLIEAQSGAAGIWQNVADDGRHCPVCGALPQLAFFDVSDEALVTGPRKLLCSRCSHTWIFERLTCAACGEQVSSRLPIFGESDTFPHMRVDACETCKRYLLTINLLKDIRAVPIVDELAALPLDLYAQERGMNKIVPNVLGN
jgi:FdhE protein